MKTQRQETKSFDFRAERREGRGIDDLQQRARNCFYFADVVERNKDERGNKRTIRAAVLKSSVVTQFMTTTKVKILLYLFKWS